MFRNSKTLENVSADANSRIDNSVRFGVKSTGFDVSNSAIAHTFNSTNASNVSSGSFKQEKTALMVSTELSGGDQGFNFVSQSTLSVNDSCPSTSTAVVVNTNAKQLVNAKRMKSKLYKFRNNRYFPMTRHSNRQGTKNSSYIFKSLQQIQNQTASANSYGNSKDSGHKNGLQAQDSLQNTNHTAMTNNDGNGSVTGSSTHSSEALQQIQNQKIASESNPYVDSNLFRLPTQNSSQNSNHTTKTFNDLNGSMIGKSEDVPVKVQQIQNQTSTSANNPYDNFNKIKLPIHDSLQKLNHSTNAYNLNGFATENSTNSSEALQQIQKQILALENNPYGDSKLFRFLIHDVDSSSPKNKSVQHSNHSAVANNLIESVVKNSTNNSEAFAQIQKPILASENNLFDSSNLFKLPIHDSLQETKVMKIINSSKSPKELTNYSQGNRFSLHDSLQDTVPTVKSNSKSRYQFKPSSSIIFKPKRRITCMTRDIFLFDGLQDEEPNLNKSQFSYKTSIKKLILKKYYYKNCLSL